jgi:hypothetical protein
MRARSDSIVTPGVARAALGVAALVFVVRHPILSLAIAADSVWFRLTGPER